jgi:4-hydroxyphenylpyruvate dioxygenase-like putative hemolysin
MTVHTQAEGRDLFENPLGADGFEFVELTSPEPERLKALFESIELDQMRRGVLPATKA